MSRGGTYDALTDSELARERAWSRIYLAPLLLAEADRDAYRRDRASELREKKLMKDVPGWEVCIQIFVWNAVLTLSLGPWHDGAWPLARTGWKERIQLEALHAQ